MEVVTGPASTVARGTDYSYAASAQHGPIPIQDQTLAFRINNRSVYYRTRALVSIRAPFFLNASTMRLGSWFPCIEDQCTLRAPTARTVH